MRKILLVAITASVVLVPAGCGAFTQEKKCKEAAAAPAVPGKGSLMQCQDKMPRT